MCPPWSRLASFLHRLSAWRAAPQSHVRERHDTSWVYPVCLADVDSTDTNTLILHQPSRSPPTAEQAQRSREEDARHREEYRQIERQIDDSLANELLDWAEEEDKKNAEEAKKDECA
ncbi:unnamed protein product [Vitrella brassicaformis CCMP3155]|uniref:Uncharacterized protein n=1 Tax=Vitrella brassicaformis (strain CCMP3155) TaxID=1169540 RepID=A0A0G4F4B6_VITBC|nr:unnamed protein product [Vitrella brassicaformis CCMP3155]|eukprot:CEM06884.1 unnamed protein product [Vitrella brassicaformis CCMP3155]